MPMGNLAPISADMWNPYKTEDYAVENDNNVTWGRFNRGLG